MRVDLRLEPYAEMYQTERPRSDIPDEFYFQDIIWLFEHLGLTWDDYSAADELDERGRFPHQAVPKLSQAIETSAVPHDVSARELLVKRREKLLRMLRRYAEWHEHPERIPIQMRDILVGRAPGLEGLVGQLPDPRPWLALALS
jgi:hypothetical protein